MDFCFLLSRFLSSMIYLLPLAWLWFTLINHLRVEWAVNPQYAYGWAVPFLCLYLIWRKIESRKQKVESGGGKAETLKAEMLKNPSAESPTPFSFSAFQLFSFFLLAFLFLPTRLVQEANPEWRLVSWALAFEVIGLTLLLLKSTGDGGWRTDDGQQATDDGRRTTADASRITHHVSHFTFQFPAFSSLGFVFPICFFLVAVPWPTFIEGPLVQGLMRANVGVTIALLGLTGVPAIQHGNVIEVASGMVGIDDACSGIRSFQAALMISLFLGELYALSARRRVHCVVAGFALAFLFNVGRTLLLTWVASAKGVGAVASWHDPAGVTILVACFLALWLIARGLRGKAEMLKAETLKEDITKAEMLKPSGQRTEDRGQRSVVSGPGFSFSAFQYFSIFLIAWLLLVEASTELWYRTHEWGVPKTSAWEVDYPRDNPTFRDLPFSDKTKQFLRYDEGCNGTWQKGSEQKWQAIFLRWNPGRIAVHLAKGHTPEVCLTAAGREVVSQTDLRAVPVHGLRLPFRSYVVKDESGPLRVFYCLWEGRANEQSFRTTKMNYANRLAPVLAGRRNSGQRSLEVAIWGIADQNEADAALARELEKLIKVEK
jgi:exosortase